MSLLEQLLRDNLSSERVHTKCSFLGSVCSHLSSKYKKNIMVNLCVRIHVPVIAALFKTRTFIKTCGLFENFIFNSYIQYTCIKERIHGMNVKFIISHDFRKFEILFFPTLFGVPLTFCCVQFFMETLRCAYIAKKKPNKFYQNFYH